jgi:hypothetical protein
MSKLRLIFIVTFLIILTLFLLITIKMDYCIQKTMFQMIGIFSMGLVTGSCLWDSIIFPKG